MADRWSEEGPDGAGVLPIVPVAPTLLDFATFYRRELPAIVTLAAAIAGTERAEEIAQEALVRAHHEGGQDYTEHLIGLPVDGDGHLEGDVPAWRYLPGGEPGTYVDCAVSRCTLRLSGETAPPTVSLSFRPGGDGPTAPTLAVEPADDLAPGDEVLVRGVGFAPGATVWLTLCARPVGEEDLGYGTCTSSQTGPGTVDEDGTFEDRFDIPEMGRLEDYYSSEGCTDEGCTEVTQPWVGEEIHCDGVQTTCEILAEVTPFMGPVATPPVFYAAPAPITFR